jgi:hypothetical protein
MKEPSVHSSAAFLAAAILAAMRLCAAMSNGEMIKRNTTDSASIQACAPTRNERTCANALITHKRFSANGSTNTLVGRRRAREHDSVGHRRDRSAVAADVCRVRCHHHVGVVEYAERREAPSRQKHACPPTHHCQSHSSQRNTYPLPAVNEGGSNAPPALPIAWLRRTITRVPAHPTSRARCRARPHCDRRCT